MKSKPGVCLFFRLYLLFLLFLPPFFFSPLNREKAERVNDPNVEYIDFNDFKGNGKYAPEKDNNNNTDSSSSSTNIVTSYSEELTKAQNILLESHQVGRISSIDFLYECLLIF
jgi:hypothetical protein